MFSLLLKDLISDFYFRSFERSCTSGPYANVWNLKVFNIVLIRYFGLFVYFGKNQHIAYNYTKFYNRGVARNLALEI